MGFSFGKSGSKGVSGQSATQRHASNILLEAILPGSSMTGGYVSDKSRPAAQGERGTTPTPTGPSLDGFIKLEGPQTKGQGSAVSRKMGNYVPSARQQGFGALMGHGMTEAYRQQVGPYTDVQGQGRVASTNPLTQGQADAVTKTLLPSLEQMRYKGAFERFDKGTLTPTAAGVIEAGSKIASDPLGQAQAAAAQIDEAILGGNIPQLPELPEITTYVEDVYSKMPDPLKNVITDLMSGGVTANIQASLEANVQAYANQANLALTDMLDETYGRFASSGVSGGAMLAAAGDVTTKVMADVAGNIANFYQQAMTTVQQERQLALQTVESLIGTAQQQQAMDFQGQTINLESTLKMAEAKYAMYTQLTNQFLDQNLAYTNIIAQEIDRENTEQINNMRMYYEILVSLATGGPALATERSKSTKFSITTPTSATNPLNTGTGNEQGNLVQKLENAGRGG